METAQLQEQHLAHLNRMAFEGYSCLTGSFGDDGEIRGDVIYTLEMPIVWPIWILWYNLDD